MRRYGIISLLLLAILALTLGGSEAQTPIYKAWPNDQLGRPAPPCMIVDPTTGITTPCSATNPIPVTGGGGSGSGTTTGSSLTGFGKQWFPSTITGTIAGGNNMAAFFLDDVNVAYLRRSTGCANCLQVAISPDGGVTGTFVSTSAVLGQGVSTAARVPSTPPRYLVSTFGGPLNIFSSSSLTSGWATVVGLANPIHTWASNATGSTVLSGASLVGVEVCRSTNQGSNFGNCSVWGAATPSGINGLGIANAGGLIWLLHNNTGQIWRSVDDGITFALVATPAASAGRSIKCLAPSLTTCIFTNTAGNVFRSTDAGATWSGVVLSGTGTQPGLCDFGGSNVGAFSGQSVPIGFAAVANTTWSSFNAGQGWFTGTISGSPWDGTGALTIRSMDCRGGRGIVTFESTGSGQVFAFYNPVTAPGGTLQSSAGGYAVTAPVQAGIILSTTPTTSGANAAAAVTLTNTAGSRICIRTISIFSSAAGASTANVTDGATVVLNLGTLVLGTAPIVYTGSPLVCSQTSNNLIVNVGAAGAAVTTTTSVVGDRYPN